MKAQELRIGNWVSNDRCLVTVASIHDGYLYVRTRQGNLIMAQLDLVKPIPLTPEILKACGFVYNENYSFKDGSNGPVFVQERYLLQDYFDGSGYGMSWWNMGLPNLNLGGGRLQ